MAGHAVSVATLERQLAAARGAAAAAEGRAAAAEAHLADIKATLSEQNATLGAQYFQVRAMRVACCTGSPGGVVSKQRAQVALAVGRGCAVVSG